MKDIRVIIILCAVCVLSFSPWSNCLEPRFRSQHSSSAVNYLCSVTRLFVRHCPLLLTTLVSAFRETRRNQYMNFPITRHSVDSSLVTSHDYDTVSCLSSALDSLIMAEHKLPTRNGKSQTSTGHSAGKRWCSISQEELVYLAFRLRGAGNFSYYPHLPEIKILIESLHLWVDAIVRCWILNERSLLKGSTKRATWTTIKRHVLQTENFNYHGSTVAIKEISNLNLIAKCIVAP